MADARTLADAIIRRLEMPVVPPSYDSPDGLPANTRALEEADDALIEAMAINSGRVSVDDLIRELVDLHNERHADCTCTNYVVDYSDPDRYHPENIDQELTPGCPEHDPAAAGTGGGA